MISGNQGDKQGSGRIAGRSQPSDTLSQGGYAGRSSSIREIVEYKQGSRGTPPARVTGWQSSRTLFGLRVISDDNLTVVERVPIPGRLRRALLWLRGLPTTQTVCRPYPELLRFGKGTDAVLLGHPEIVQSFRDWANGPSARMDIALRGNAIVRLKQIAGKDHAVRYIGPALDGPAKGKEFRAQSRKVRVPFVRSAAAVMADNAGHGGPSIGYVDYVWNEEACGWTCETLGVEIDDRPSRVRRMTT